MAKRDFFNEMGWVALGGMIGALLRHLTNQLFILYYENNYLFTATALENILGSFFIGLTYIILCKKFENNKFLNLFLLTGIIGSYTTYSGFMIEAFLISTQSFITFLSYIFLQIIVGIFALWLGLGVGEKINKTT